MNNENGGAPTPAVANNGSFTPETMQAQMQSMQQLMNQHMELLRLQMQNTAATVAQTQPPQPTIDTTTNTTTG